MARTIEQRLQSLHAKREALQQQITQLEREQSKELRKRQQQRERIVGKVIYALVQSGEWTEQQLLDLVDQHLTRVADRRLFSLPTLCNTSKSTPSTQTSVIEDTAASKTKKVLTSKPHSKSAPAAKSTSSTTKTKLPEPADKDALMQEFNL